MDTAHKIIRIAKGEVGYHEGRANGHWDNKERYADQVPTLAWVNAGGYPWCAVFVCWCFNQADALDLIPGGATASVAHFRDAAKAAGRFSEYPAVGAIILYGQNGDAHTGVVVAYDDTTVTTVEGNTNTDGSAEGDGVYLKTHSRTDTWVYGYAYPTFPEGIDSADPKWADKAPQEPSKSLPHQKSERRSGGHRGPGLVAHARGLLNRALRRARSKIRKRRIRRGLRKLPKH